MEVYKFLVDFYRPRMNQKSSERREDKKTSGWGLTGFPMLKKERQTLDQFLTNLRVGEEDSSKWENFPEFRGKPSKILRNRHLYNLPNFWTILHHPPNKKKRLCQGTGISVLSLARTKQGCVKGRKQTWSPSTEGSFTLDQGLLGSGSSWMCYENPRGKNVNKSPLNKSKVGGLVPGKLTF